MKQLFIVITIATAIFVACGGGKSSSTPPRSDADVLHLEGLDISRQDYGRYLSVEIVQDVFGKASCIAVEGESAEDIVSEATDHSPGNLSTLVEYGGTLVHGQRADREDEMDSIQMLLDLCKELQ